MNPFSLIFGGLKVVGSFIHGWQKRKILKQEAKIKITEMKLKHQIRSAEAGQFADIDIDKSVTDQMASTWKDEYLLILFSIPLVLCFIPGMDVYVLNGFAALKKTPTWYQAAVGIIVAATFGYRKYANIMMKRLGMENGNEPIPSTPAEEEQKSNDDTEKHPEPDDDTENYPEDDWNLQ